MPFQNVLCRGPATKLPSIQSDKYLLSTYCVPSTHYFPPGTPGVSKQYSLILPQQELNIIAQALFWRLGFAKITAYGIHSTPLAWKWGWFFQQKWGVESVWDFNSVHILIWTLELPYVHQKGKIHSLPSAEGFCWESVSIFKMSLKP